MLHPGSSGFGDGDDEFTMDDLEPNQLNDLPTSTLPSMRNLVTNGSSSANIVAAATNAASATPSLNNQNLINKLSQLLSASSNSNLSTIGSSIAASSLIPQLSSTFMSPANASSDSLNLGDLLKLEGLPFNDSDFVSVLDDIKEKLR